MDIRSFARDDLDWGHQFEWLDASVVGPLPIVGVLDGKAMALLDCENLSSEPEDCLCIALGALSEIPEHVLRFAEGRLKSAMEQVRFMAFSKTLEAPYLESILLRLNLPQHQAVWIEMGRILKLPRAIQKFCALKGLSFKPLLNLAYIPTDILELVFSWQDRLQLTVAYFDAWARGLRHLIKQSGKDLVDLVEEIGINVALASGQSPSQVSRGVQECLFKAQHPTLSEHNRQLERLCTELPYLCSWDRSLETKALDISFKIQRVEDLDLLMDDLVQSKQSIRSALALL